MGRSPKPLRIVCYPPVSDWPELAALAEQGHEIYLLTTEADLVLGPQCWRLDEPHRKYLDLAIKEARRIRYPTAAKETDGTSQG